jgi:hypothetical protein
MSLSPVLYKTRAEEEGEAPAPALIARESDICLYKIIVSSYF